MGLAHPNLESMKKGQKPPTNRTRSTLRPPNNRSKITNGRGLLPGVHSQSLWARRFRDLLSLHLSDLGGEDNCSEGEKALVRRAACLIVELEQLETVFAQDHDNATPQRLDLYQRLTNTLRRLLETLMIGEGLRRRQKDVTPTLPEYIRHKAQEKARAAEDAEIEEVEEV